MREDSAMSLLRIVIISVVIAETKLYTNFLRDIYSLLSGCNLFTAAAAADTTYSHLQLLYFLCFIKDVWLRSANKVSIDEVLTLTTIKQS